MQCPKCQDQLRSVDYEGVHVESCESCGGEWLDSAELGHVVEAREARFNPEEKRAIAQSTTIRGVSLTAADRDLTCPKCGGTTDAINYGGDTGIILDRCTGCGGFWLDGGELEKVQMLIEGWEDKLPDDLKQYGPRLRQVAVEVDQRDDVHISRYPLVGRWINTMINGILDLQAR